MGNVHPSLQKETKVFSSRFDEGEMCVLEKTWQEMADRNDGRGIDKNTFLQWISLTGLLGDRMFTQFDLKSNDSIDFDDFIIGLSIACRGDFDEKCHFLFQMMDSNHNKKISKQQLATFLNQVPKEVLHRHDEELRARRLTLQVETGGLAAAGVGAAGADNGVDESGQVRASDRDSVDNFTNNDVCEEAFKECDIYNEGWLTYEEFKMWLQLNPSLLEYIEGAMPFATVKSAVAPNDKMELLPYTNKNPHRSSITSRNEVAGMTRGISGTGLSLKNWVSRSSSEESGLTTPTSRRDSLTSRSEAGIKVNNNNRVDISKVLDFDKNKNFVSGDGPFPNRAREDSNASLLSSQNDEQNVSNNFSTLFNENDMTAMSLLAQAFQVAENESLRSHIAAVVEAFQSNHPIVPTVVNITKETFSHLHMEDYLGDAGTLSESTKFPMSMVGNGNGNGHNAAKASRKGYLWKTGKAFHFMNKRYYVLSNNCLYYYGDETDTRPKGVIFLTGSIIAKYKDDYQESRGYFGFELLHQDLCAGEHHKHEHRVLYCRSSVEREEWIHELQHAAHVVPIEDDYFMGKQIGEGRFSVVYECVHKVTGKHCAVKKINKETIESDEKQLLRTEIVVLKLMHHPNIIKLEGIYESKNSLFIVMEILTGGDLFHRIVGRPRFKEEEAARVIRPILEAIAYLHDLGIVHRDIKPENILCGTDIDDLKIADFGLSRMILPAEKLNTACGTLSYVAPEVLAQYGYGKEVDLWSIGVIFFLLLCGKLPFDGENPKETLLATIEKNFEVNPVVWNNLSPEARDLITAFLKKDPKERITARSALKHPFLLNYQNTKKVKAETPRAHGSAGLQTAKSAEPFNGEKQSLTFTEPNKDIDRQSGSPGSAGK